MNTVGVLSRGLEGLVSRIERATVLDRPADAVAGRLGRILGAGPLPGLLSGSASGHAVHPALVMAPMGAWGAAAFLDVTGGPGARPAARALVGAGLVSAVPAAVTGANDWVFTTGAERRVGFVHAAANYVALGLFGASWWARGRRRHALATTLSLTGTAAIAASGWLGGHLTYARGVGVDTTAFQVAPSDWVDAMALAELIAGQPVAIHAGGIPVLLVLDDSGVLRALADRCSHRGGPLHEGTVMGDCIQCPWHGGRFRLADGSVVAGPPSRPQPVFETRLREGMVQVRRSDEPGSLRTNPVS